MPDATKYLEMASSIVAAYVSRNTTSPGDVPRLIADVYAGLHAVSRGEAPRAVATEELKPLLPIKKTITPEFIISLEDGKPYRSLKRHLAALGMTPEQYRRKWSLPPDYPMVSSGYSALRSALAKGIGLGEHQRTGRTA
ncbi:MAG: MucR family transcriptional regulator [Devosia sp.]|nr:MucR family transcriptional regulator [Devosia sp.]